jgi:hypothetical protein
MEQSKPHRMKSLDRFSGGSDLIGVSHVVMKLHENLGNLNL